MNTIETILNLTWTIGGGIAALSWVRHKANSLYKAKEKRTGYAVWYKGPDDTDRWILRVYDTQAEAYQVADTLHTILDPDIDRQDITIFYDEVPGKYPSNDFI